MDESQWKNALNKEFSLPLPARSIKNVHASDISRPEFCQRRVQFARDGRRANNLDFFSPSTQMTFALGLALEDALVKKLSESPEVDVFSKWSWQGFDLGCGTRAEIEAKAEKVPLIQKVKKPTFSTGNVPFKRGGISGSIDLIMKTKADQQYQVFEVKTIKAEDFKMLDSPLTEHRERTSLYLGLVEGHEYPINISTEAGYVIYISKGFGVKDGGTYTPFKVFKVERDERLNSVFFSKALWEGDGKRSCRDRSAGEKRRCEFVAECFGAG